jgi:hypothetical protein
VLNTEKMIRKREKGKKGVDGVRVGEYEEGGD